MHRLGQCPDIEPLRAINPYIPLPPGGKVDLEGNFIHAYRPPVYSSAETDHCQVPLVAATGATGPAKGDVWDHIDCRNRLDCRYGRIDIGRRGFQPKGFQ